MVAIIPSLPRPIIVESQAKWKQVKSTPNPERSARATVRLFSIDGGVQMQVVLQLL
jgi:hypothetical protein